MRDTEVREIIEILSADREVFYYFKDRYAAMLLGYVAGDGMPVRAIKESQFRGLLDKPHIREIVRRAHDGIVTSDMFAASLLPLCNVYVITLDEWRMGDFGRVTWEYGQTSRQGRNLVLQLNFSNQHDRYYRRLIRPGGGAPFNYWAHPVNGRGRHTLAWARIDLSLESGEALIEEVQNDWLRAVLRKRKTVQEQGPHEGFDRAAQRCVSPETTAENFGRYCNQVLGAHADIWDEAILAAAISFLVEKVGIRKIFYHTFEGGNLWKGIHGTSPPKSLYTSLPRRFGFREVTERPSFLTEARPQAQIVPPRRTQGSKRRKCPDSAEVTRLIPEETRFFLLEL